MIVDTSALIAILFDEPESPIFIASLARSSTSPELSAVSCVEAAIVAVARRGPRAAAEVFALIDALKIEIVAFDPAQAGAAADAFIRFGKGRHPAALNFGDCCAYALARARGVPMLFKGGDFSQTDIVPAGR